MNGKIKTFSTDGVARKYEAYAHYLGASEEPRRLDINELGLNIQPEDFPAVTDALQVLKGRNSGMSVYGFASFDIPLDNSNSLVLGQKTLFIRGVIDSKKDGTRVFNGLIDSNDLSGANPDLYNLEPRNDRTENYETKTKYGREIGIIFGAKPYEIYIEGKLPVSKTYTKDD